MALQSQLFRGDPKLDAAAVSDPAHILLGQRGPHVAKIQQALNKVGGAALDPDGAFGPGTAAAVRAFKTDRQILNFQGKIDEIVGKKTIAALDAELLATENGGIKSGGQQGIRGAGGSITVVPFTKSRMTLIKTFDDRVPIGRKNDLNETNPPNPPLNIAEAIVVGLARGQFDFVLEAAMRTELDQLAPTIGLEMFNRFKNNIQAGKEEFFFPGSNLSRMVEKMTGFQKAHNDIRLEFEAALNKQATTGTLDVNALEATNDGPTGRFGRRQLTNPDGVKTSIDLLVPVSEFILQIVVGGSFQGGEVILVDFTADASTGTYRGTLEYRLIDHFGVDNSDVMLPLPHGSPGQIAFWILQHERHPGHMPYVTTVVIERTVSGKFVV